MNQKGRLPVLSIPILLFPFALCACSWNPGTLVEHLPDDPHIHGYVQVSRIIDLPRGRLPAYCGPESLSAVLSFHDHPVDPEAIAVEILSRQSAGGTNATNLLQYATERGFRAESVHPSIGRIKMAIEADTPPIILVSQPGTDNNNPSDEPACHFFVVQGYNDRERQIVCPDYHDRLRLIDYDELNASWASDSDLLIIRPGSEQVHFETAARFQKIGRFKQALDHYTRALKADPGHVMARVGTGDCRYALGDIKGAAKEYEAALDAHPGHPQAANNLAWALLDLERDPRQAEALATRAVDRFRVLLDRTREERAAAVRERDRTHLDKTLATRRSDLAQALDTLGRARLTNGDPARAAAAWQASLDHLPLDRFDDRARRMLRIARCHRKMDMPGSAREWFDRALGAARDPALKKEIQNER